MAIIASNAKRTKTNRKSEAANKSQRSSLKTSLRSFNSAIESGDKEKAEILFNQSNSLLDKSITSNIHHKNYVARKKSDLSLKLNSLK
ncbi:30S ribosomal protein S20 [Erysipelothrix rhusiopathiae]|uniref:Small ribosomal subunit protein bS20 n=1 Tax=Erysipelothrix rhusiopathiae ATCC 19414 TaxID=525280 RepID=E7FTY5_ERYRH|nr:30S ribosomal protein S20 [Erysipelothrix rhusiopathiae]AGN23713.1 30S ribosomal protein S20 [Erysipelothrix rhusiopathiae SY1027]AMS11511.1 30S ribosomal protein S20 [Erysipelothrix rhusiopathiae]AOO68010.1 30S ribosomal protein S20 [Erysipelothrix rhusiopathiae]AWU41143.1 30S ribosomal protein S20 [Erysipelothrix rhusiopathiae]EFY09271.1 ribosomal protein S20 [Erysipelothrix rhusiopathiae ATCC 19414]